MNTPVERGDGEVSAMSGESLGAVVEALRAEADRLRADNDLIRLQLDGLAASIEQRHEPARPERARHEETQSTPPSHDSVPRRSLLRVAGVAVAGGVAGAIVASRPVAAGDGDPLTLGATNLSASTTYPQAGQAPRGISVSTNGIQTARLDDDDSKRGGQHDESSNSNTTSTPTTPAPGHRPRLCASHPAKTPDEEESAMTRRTRRSRRRRHSLPPTSSRHCITVSPTPANRSSPVRAGRKLLAILAVAASVTFMFGP